tara:strand:+ start:251 stop:556 length:306 start_codon:yes stop_codon:yes gene_type:complete
MNKIIFLVLFIISTVNALSDFYLRGLSRYRNSLVFNIGKNIKNEVCPIVDYFETRSKKADDLNFKFKWTTIAGPWNLHQYNHNEEILYNMLEQHGEVSLIE